MSIEINSKKSIKLHTEIIYEILNIGQIEEKYFIKLRFLFVIPDLRFSFDGPFTFYDDKPFDLSDEELFNLNILSMAQEQLNYTFEFTQTHQHELKECP